MAPGPMTMQGGGMPKQDPPSYCTVKNEISYCCRNIAPLKQLQGVVVDPIGIYTPPKGFKQEYLRLPNATCNIAGCRSKGYGQCEGEYKYIWCCAGRYGPLLWSGCGRTLCSEHMKYYNWLDGQSHLTACDLPDCAGRIEKVKWVNYCCRGGWAEWWFCCLGSACTAEKRKCMPDGTILVR